MYLEYTRLLGGLIISLSLIPQIKHTYTTKTAEDLSYNWQFIYVLGLSLSMFYEIYHKFWFMYLTTGVEMICVITLIGMKYRFTPPQKTLEV